MHLSQQQIGDLCHISVLNSSFGQQECCVSDPENGDFVGANMLVQTASRSPSRQYDPGAHDLELRFLS
jgi:hypothetical protein